MAGTACCASQKIALMAEGLKKILNNLSNPNFGFTINFKITDWWYKQPGHLH